MDAIFQLHRGSVPLLVSLPHDGSAIPDALAARMVPEARRAPDTDWHVARLYAFARELGASVLVPRHSRYVIDLNRGEDIQGWVAATVERFGGVDILINNAGAAQGGPFLTLPDQAWLDSWQLKLFGYIRVAREVFPQLVRRGGGRIVNVIGIAGVQPLENYMIGGAANAALLNFTKALADEGAPHGILVTGVNPGPIHTDRWDGMVNKWAAAKKTNTSPAIAAMIPVVVRSSISICVSQLGSSR